MEKLIFINANGVRGFTCEWPALGAEYDAPGWMEEFGSKIGTGTAPLPDGSGWIDLAQFATVKSVPSI